MAKFNFIIKQDAPEEPEVKRCCGTCGKLHKVLYSDGVPADVNICKDTLTATAAHYGGHCKDWTDPDPDIQDVEVRLNKCNDGIVLMEFVDSTSKWHTASALHTNGGVHSHSDISEYL